MTQFSDIPTEKFPLNYDTYCQMQDRLRASAKGFSYLGTADGHMVSRELNAVSARLAHAWEIIRGVEHRELGR